MDPKSPPARSSDERLTPSGGDAQVIRAATMCYAVGASPPSVLREAMGEGRQPPIRRDARRAS